MVKKNNATSQMDLFLNDADDWNPKSDRASLEHPFFSLTKKKDLSIRRYRSPDGKVSVEVTPSVKGMATIFDKDILIYAITVLRAAMTREKAMAKDPDVGFLAADALDLKEGASLLSIDTINDFTVPKTEGIEKYAVPVKSRPINLIAYNLLNAIERGTSGRDYKDLEEALDRLSQTSIKTNIPVGRGYVCTESFRIIDKYKIIREEATGKMLSIQIVLSDWLWTVAVEGDKDLLAIDREYFSMRGAMERRIYGLCRKHCGYQSVWMIGMEKLYMKSGSDSSYGEFRRLIRKVIEKNALPRYILSYDQERDLLVARNRIAVELAAQ